MFNKKEPLAIKRRLENTKIAVLGLGYVGLPLALEFSKKFAVVGFDISLNRIEELKSGADKTNEIAKEELSLLNDLHLTSDVEDLKTCNVFIVTVPTPIDDLKRPNLEPLESASATVGSVLKTDDIVIFESTVFPGATEDVCTPILEKKSNLKLNVDFSVGYSPERINPGDEVNRLTSIVKVTSGSNPQAADYVDALYAKIITAGTHRTSSIRVAEAAKVIENTQRDLNIALINELAILFNKLKIDTEEVLQAAGSKWNFLPFKPGLVGGHCIGVDPYYLTHKAAEIGYHPHIILAGRRLNDGMSDYVASNFIKKMISKSINVKNSRVLVMGITFKENCPDVRNSKVIDLIKQLNEFELNVEYYDPWVNHNDLKSANALVPAKTLQKQSYDGVILAVAHNEFKEMGLEKIKWICKPNRVIYDLKHQLPQEGVDLRL